MFERFYGNKRVLVTGHTGFKGSWLTAWLSMLEARVVGYALEPPSEPSFFGVCGSKTSVIDIRGDIRDLPHLISVVREYHPEIVFHLAAQALVRRSYEEPRLTYETNVMGTVNLLEAVRANESVRATVIVTSDKCYENHESLWGYRECDPLGGHDPYSCSKACAELVSSGWRSAFFAPGRYDEHRVGLASARAGNVIGGGDWGKDRLVPDCVRALAAGETIMVRSPKAIRPWQHVLEPLSGYLLLGALLWEDGSHYGEAWNFGPEEGENWTVEQVVEAVIGKWGGGRYEIVESGNQPSEHQRLSLDCTKAKIRLGWRPKYPLERALAETVAWYRSFYSGASRDEMWRLTSMQIKDYMALKP
jgi:CDP-glucose 4,6-dehydratase